MNKIIALIIAAASTVLIGDGLAALVQGTPPVETTRSARAVVQPADRAEPDAAVEAAAAPTPPVTAALESDPLPRPDEHAHDHGEDAPDSTSGPVEASGADPGTADLVARSHAAIRTHVPARWLDLVPYDLEMIPGNTSYALGRGLIRMGRGQSDDSWEHISFIAVHEFGHLVSFRHGTGAYAGAPPAGFPGSGNQAEVWADCFAWALTGVDWNAMCTSAQRDWTGDWVRTN